MEHLKAYLKSVPQGEITDVAELENLLAECWDEFSGDYGGMTPRKLRGRMEEVDWKHPVLTFVLERHGAIVAGSSRAELQLWILDLEKKTASVHPWGRRQVYPMQARVDVNPIADEVVALIINNSEDERLQWSADGHVRVLTGRIFPAHSAVKQTLEGRKQRFYNAVTERLAQHGWQCRGSWWQRKE